MQYILQLPTYIVLSVILCAGGLFPATSNGTYLRKYCLLHLHFLVCIKWENTSYIVRRCSGGGGAWIWYWLYRNALVFVDHFPRGNSKGDLIGMAFFLHNILYIGQIHPPHLRIHKYFTDNSSVNFHDKVFLHFLPFFL